MGGPSVPPAYQPTGTASQDAAVQAAQGLQAGQATTGNTLAQNVVNNPYAASVIPGAQKAGNYLTGTLAPQLQGASTGLSNSANLANTYGLNVINTAMDPQNALYARTAQQVADAQQAANAAAGVANTPYGAGVAGQTAANFNIDWQNAQLQRQLSGLSGYDTNLGAVGNAQAQAGNLGRGAAESEVLGSGLPYSTHNAMQGSGLEALGLASGLAGSAAGTGQNYLNYTNSAYQNQLAQYNANEKQWSDMWGGIGQGIGLLGSFF